MLTGRDKNLLAYLAEHPKGLPVKNAMVERFGAYEGAGLVRLSAARFGPLRLPDDEHFWAKITPEGVAALQVT